jgi:uncharacterized membrane protein
MFLLLLTSFFLGLSCLPIFYKGKHFWLISLVSVIIATSITFELWENLSEKWIGVLVISFFLFLFFVFLAVTIKSETRNFQLIRDAIERATKKK